MNQEHSHIELERGRSMTLIGIRSHLCKKKKKFKRFVSNVRNCKEILQYNVNKGGDTRKKYIDKLSLTAELSEKMKS